MGSSSWSTEHKQKWQVGEGLQEQLEAMTGLSPAPPTTSEPLDAIKMLAWAMQSIRQGHATSDRAGVRRRKGWSRESPRRCRAC